MRLYFCMDIITSSKNSAVKEAAKLADKKYRELSSSFLAEGINVIRDMPDDAEIISLFVTPKREAEAKNLLAYTRARVYYVSDDVMKSLSDTVTPYGVAAVVAKPNRPFELPRGNALLLDGLSDPGNVGTILRTAAATGFSDVYLLDCADVYSPKTVRASLGGLFRVRTYEIQEEQAVELIGRVNSVALDMGGGNLLKGAVQSPVLYAVGNEAHGLRTAVKNNVKRVMGLPMSGGMESLNAAVACSVAMYRTIQEAL